MSFTDTIEVMIDNGVRPSSNTNYRYYLLRCQAFHHELNRQNAHMDLPSSTIAGEAPNVLIVDWLQVVEAINLTGTVYYARGAEQDAHEPTVTELEEAVRSWWKTFTSTYSADSLCTVSELRVDGYYVYRGLFDSLRLTRVSGKDDRMQFSLVFLSSYKEGFGKLPPPYTGLSLYYKKSGVWTLETDKRQLTYDDAMSGRVRAISFLVGNPKEINTSEYDAEGMAEIKLVEPKYGNVVFKGRLDSKKSYPTAFEGEYLKCTARGIGALLQEQTVDFDCQTPSIHKRSELIETLIKGGSLGGLTFFKYADVYDVLKVDINTTLDNTSFNYIDVHPHPHNPNPNSPGYPDLVYGRNYINGRQTYLKVIADLATEDPFLNGLDPEIGYDFYVDDIYSSTDDTPTFRYFKRGTNIAGNALTAWCRVIFYADYHSYDTNDFQYNTDFVFAAEGGKEQVTAVTVRTGRSEFDAYVTDDVLANELGMVKEKVVWDSSIRTAEEAEERANSILTSGVDSVLMTAKISIPGFMTWHDCADYQQLKPLRAGQRVIIFYPYWMWLRSDWQIYGEFVITSITYTEPPATTVIKAVEYVPTKTTGAIELIENILRGALDVIDGRLTKTESWGLGVRDDLDDVEQRLEDGGL